MKNLKTIITFLLALTIIACEKQEPIPKFTPEEEAKMLAEYKITHDEGGHAWPISVTIDPGKEKIQENKSIYLEIDCIKEAGEKTRLTIDDIIKKVTFETEGPVKQENIREFKPTGPGEFKIKATYHWICACGNEKVVFGEITLRAE